MGHEELVMAARVWCAAYRPVKFPDRTMVGRIGIHSGRKWIEYVEKHYRGGKLESTTTFACRPIKPEIRDEDWKEGRKGTRNYQLTGGNDAASKKNWHTATHQILAWPPYRPGDFKIQLVSPPFGWADRSRKQQRSACDSSHPTCA
jgi:hypothetical protein